MTEVLRSKKKSCTIVIVARDKFSTTECCLDSIFQVTTEWDEVSEVILVLGGAPEKICDRLKTKFAGKARFIFEDRFLNPSESRNIGLKACKTPLAVLMDNDVLVRPGWLGALLSCQRETNSAMVTPIVLETENVIHTAGNDFYISYKDGQGYAHKELRNHGLNYWDRCDLRRQPVDYGELHCQLVEVETAVRLRAYDENLQEVAECDSGLSWKKAGCAMFFEPGSVVYYMLGAPVQAEDIKFFRWRWDMRLIKKGYDYFKEKWGVDITESGQFGEFLLKYNRKLGFLPRTVPSAAALFIARSFSFGIRSLRRIILIPLALWRRYTAQRLGFYEWPKVDRGEDMESLWFR